MLKTLKSLNDPKFDLVTPRTLCSTNFEQNVPQNWELSPRYSHSMKIPNLSPEVKATAWKLGIFGSKHGVARCSISQYT